MVSTELPAVLVAHEDGQLPMNCVRRGCTLRQIQIQIATGRQRRKTCPVGIVNTEIQKPRDKKTEIETERP